MGLILRYFPSVTALFVGTALAGIGIAMGNVLLPSLIKREFPEKPGLLTGVFAVSMNMLAAVSSGISVPLAHNLSSGWHGSLSIWAILTVVAIIVWLPQLRKQHKPLASQTKMAGSLWGSSLAWKVTLFMGLQSLVFYIIIAWLPVILTDQGISKSAAGWILSLMQFVSLPASFIVPILAGRFRNQRGLVTMTAAFLILGYIGLISGNFPLTIVSVILIGLAGGSAFSLATMFFVLRTQTTHEAAALSGMAQSIGYLLAAMGPTLFGLTHDITHSWLLPLIILIIVAILIWTFGMSAGNANYVAYKRKNATV